MLLVSDQQQSGWIYVAVLGAISIICVLLWLLNRAIVRFFPSTRQSRGSFGNALVRMEASFLPGREHIAEAIEYDEMDEESDGDPPKTGNICGKKIEITKKPCS